MGGIAFGSSIADEIMTPANLAERFAIPNALRFEEGPGGLTRAVISTPAADAEIYLHGAHVTHWKPRGAEPVLFLSSKSFYEQGKAIRGGVPIVFPWFGPRGDGEAGPMHGFARTMEWSVDGTKLREDGSVEIALGLEPNEVTRGFGYDAFHLRFRLTAGERLKMELETRNDAAEPLVFQEALHTYFAAADIYRVWVSGLEDTVYIDKTDGFQRKGQGSEPIHITSEIDRVYVNTTSTCVIADPALGRRILVEKSGSDATVVWNPWADKIKSFADMAPDDWKHMICVETANAGDHSIHLAPGALHTLTTSIRTVL
jgi:glucose-6-phosphate 1-epimerase